MPLTCLAVIIKPQRKSYVKCQPGKESRRIVNQAVFNSADSRRRGGRGLTGESESDRVCVYTWEEGPHPPSVPLSLSEPIIASFSWYSHCSSSTHIQSISVWLHLQDTELDCPSDVLIPDPSCSLQKEKLSTPPALPCPMDVVPPLFPSIHLWYCRKTKSHREHISHRPQCKTVDRMPPTWNMLRNKSFFCVFLSCRLLVFPQNKHRKIPRKYFISNETSWLPFCCVLPRAD